MIDSYTRIYERMGSKIISFSETTAHRHSFYEILYYTGGSGIHFIDFEPYPLITPMLFLIAPGQVHCWDIQAHLDGYVLFFTEAFPAFSPINQSLLFDIFHNTHKPYLQLNKSQTDTVNTIIKTIETEYLSDQFRRTSVIQAYLHILLIQIKRTFPPIIENKQPSGIAAYSIIRRFRQLVTSHFKEGLSVQVYADKMKVSVSHLIDTLKSITGSTPGEIIRREIILEAKRLLIHTELNITEIGYQLDFEDSSYFGRFFKREAGMSPMAFRQSFQKVLT